MTNTIPDFVLGISTLEEETCLLVTLTVEVVEQGRIGGSRELRGQGLDVTKEGHEIRFGIGGRHVGDGVLQLDEFCEQVLMQTVHDQSVALYE